jgi:hypothetical protein
MLASSRQSVGGRRAVESFNVIQYNVRSPVNQGVRFLISPFHKEFACLTCCSFSFRYPRFLSLRR